MKSAGLLGDTSARDYSRKLNLFNACAEPEIRRAIASLDLKSGMRVLDAGWGTGEALTWLQQSAPGVIVAGIDLASAHTNSARLIRAKTSSCQSRIVHADLMRPPYAPASFDLVWSVNTINHLHDPVSA